MANVLGSKLMGVLGRAMEGAILALGSRAGAPGRNPGTIDFSHPSQPSPAGHSFTGICSEQSAAREV